MDRCLKRCLAAAALAGLTVWPAPAAAQPAAAPAEEQEIPLDLATQSLGGAEVGGVVIRGFFVGSLNFTSRWQMVPEFAGGAPALSAPGTANFRFDKFGIAGTRHFASWLTAGAAAEVERHADAHAHGFAPAFGCNGGGACVEQFGAEEPETEVSLDLFDVSLTAPVGNGLVFSFGRFDTPFGIERHDEPLNVTATSSELYRFGRPQKMTGLQVGYQFSPTLDVVGWVVNRWESETTDDEFDDNNRGKSLGGRVGFTTLNGRRPVNVGVGGFWGAEQAEGTARRWVVDVDATATASSRLFVAAEFLRGGEGEVSFRARGIPYAQPAFAGDASWWAAYVMPHYDVRRWLGLTARYGVFGDEDGARTGIVQRLQSLTLAPIFHLTRAIPGLSPTGAAFSRTRHPIDWVDLKLEYRFGHSDHSIFSDEEPATDVLEASQSGHEFHAQMVVNF